MQKTKFAADGNSQTQLTKLFCQVLTTPHNTLTTLGKVLIITNTRKRNGAFIGVARGSSSNELKQIAASDKERKPNSL